MPRFNILGDVKKGYSPKHKKGFEIHNNVKGETGEINPNAQDKAKGKEK